MDMELDLSHEEELDEMEEVERPFQTKQKEIKKFKLKTAVYVDDYVWDQREGD